MEVVQLNNMENHWWGMSPRISFSHDLQAAQPGAAVDVLLAGNSCRETDHAADFRFDVRRGVEDETSTADELFSGGKIIPLHPRSTLRPPALLPCTVPALLPKKERLREAVAGDDDSSVVGSLKSLFMRLKRSSNLNSGLLQKLPSFGRSSSTGSSSDDRKKKPGRAPSSLRFQPMASPVAPAPKKKEKGSLRSIGYGHSVRISPVLNVPPPYISSGTTNLFGFGYFFRPVKETPTNPKKSDKIQLRKAKSLQ